MTKITKQATTLDRRAALGSLAAAGALLASSWLPESFRGNHRNGPQNQHFSAEQLAAAKFEPWEHGDDEWKPPSNDEWVQLGEVCLPTIRIAWLMMYKKKEELEHIASGLDDKAFEELADSIISVREFFDTVHRMLDGAECRLMAAATSALKKIDPEGFAKA